MNTILRNFFSVLRKFRVATILNILGLTIAFAAFILLMIQVSFDLNFNKSISHSEQIMRVEYTWNPPVYQAIINRPMSEMLFQSSPHILAGVLMQGPAERVIEIEKNGHKSMFKEKFCLVSDGFPDVFPLEITEGIADAIREPDKALLPESMARKLFGDEPAVGNQVNFPVIPYIGGGTYTVGGVYKDFPLNSSVENVIYYNMGDRNKENWGNWNYTVYIKLDDASVADEIVENFMQKGPYAEQLKNEDGTIEEDMMRLTPFADLHFIKNIEWDMVEKASPQTVLILIAIAIVLLIIAAINYTNFSMALTPMRIKSINTQKVLGADIKMLRKALLAEAFTICIISFLLSLGVVYGFSVSEFRELISGDLSLTSHIGLILLTGMIAGVVAMIAGLYPAYYVTSFSPALVLKGNFGLSSKGRVLRNLLIGIQYVASFALIIIAGFMYLQNHYMQNASLGYDKDAIIVATINSDINERLNAFTNEISSYSGIENVTYSELLLSSGDNYQEWGGMYRGEPIYYELIPVDSSFLKVMNVPVVEGRNFRPEDAGTTEGALLFNQTAKHKYGLEIGEKTTDRTIIGFVPDINFASFRTEIAPMAFYVWGTETTDLTHNYAYIKVKAESNFTEAFNHVKNTLSTFDESYPFEVFFFDEVLQRTYEKEQKVSLMITLFSLLAIFISIVGVFGLVIFESQYRIKEIGVRKVMGSTTSQIVWMFNKVYFRILAICFILAAPIGYLIVKEWLQNFAYRTPMHWWVFLAAFIVVGIITAITVTFQNWRTASSNPVESIKTE